MNTYDIIKNLSIDQYLLNQVAYCVCKYKRLLLSYSGGLDSTVLLDILTTLLKDDNPFILRAVYVDHGFHVNSVDWANHCAEQCKIRNIPFNIIPINYHDISGNSKNFESTARMLRYQKLCNYLYSEEILLTAHHMDDQVETVLLALKRGSGPAGLSGIHEHIKFYNTHQILRPLLKCSREQLKSYASKKKLIWVEDNTNKNINFDRNFLRIQVIPLLKKRWPSFNIVVNRSAELCRNQENLLKELLFETVNSLIDLDGALFYESLLQYTLIKRLAVLRYWLSNFFTYMPSYQLLNRIWTEVVLSKSDANPVLNFGKHVCCRFRKKLYILPVYMILTTNLVSLSWNLLNTTILLPLKLGLLIYQKLTININEYQSSKLSKLNMDLNFVSGIYWKHFKTAGNILTNCLVRAPQEDEQVSIRFGYVGELLYIVNRNRGRKLKKLWQEFSIPPWLRNRIPLLFYNNTLIAALGIFITQEGTIENTIYTNDQHNTVWQIIWMQDKLNYTMFQHTVHYYLH